MNTRITKVIVIHVPTEWRRTNRRWAFRALSETLPAHVAVLCVNRPVDLVVTPLRNPRKFWNGVWRTRIEREDNRLAIVTPRIPVNEILAAHVPGMTAFNTKCLGRQLRRTLRDLFPNVMEIIQWIHHPHQRWVYDAVPGCGKVYHCYDEYTCAPDGTFRPEVWEQEMRLLHAADLVFATSQPLIPRREPHARRIVLLPNGFPDFFLRETKERDDPIDAVPRPRIGYVGNIFSIIDFALLEALFRKRNDWQMVFIGPVEKESHIRTLRTMPNVHFVGPRPHESLPQVLSKIDVALVPVVVNEFTRPFSPLKLFEYLGSGVPVVSTDFEELASFRPLIRLVPCTVDGFEQAISATLDDDRDVLSRRLRAEAAAHTWTAINRTCVVPVLEDVFSLQCGNSPR